MTRWPRAGAATLLACALMLELGCASARAKRANWTPAPAARGNAPTVESKDPALAAALLRLAVHPSAEAHEAVSQEYQPARSARGRLRARHGGGHDGAA